MPFFSADVICFLIKQKSNLMLHYTTVISHRHWKMSMEDGLIEILCMVFILHISHRQLLCLSLYQNIQCTKQKTWQGMWFNNLDVDAGETSRHMLMSASGSLVIECYIGLPWMKAMCLRLGVTNMEVDHLSIVLFRLELTAPEATPQLSHTWQVIISYWHTHQLLDCIRKSTRYYISYSYNLLKCLGQFNELINVMP